MKKLLVKKEDANERIDKFLRKEIFLNQNKTRGDIIRHIKSGNILVDDKIIKPGYLLKEGQKIKINIKKEKAGIIPNKKISLSIVYQDKNIIIVNKPPGISVHPSNPSEKNTLVNFLTYKFPEIKTVHDNSRDAYLRPGVVHRLDKDTSGVIIIARNQKAFEELKKLFQEHKIEKKYLALVYGKLENKKGKIEKPIARASTYRKQVVAGKKTQTKIREAVTEYSVIKKYANCSLIEVIPKTGRMHQIRVHLFSIGHPIIGDSLYILKKYKKTKTARQLLHAQELNFKLFDKTFSFQAPLPLDFRLFLDEIRKKG
jgi:23S rRNA pseudouridine1911/1915/1917 synthase